MASVAHTLGDGAVVARRNLIKIKRVPELLLWTTMSPIMFVLLFGYIFGSAIVLQGTTYREFLIAGIFAQTVVFGATFTGAGMAEDMQKGIIDRFRSLPMARSAVLVGRTASDIAYNSISLVVMSLTGLLIGWSISTNALEALGGYLLLLFFAYAVSWVMAYVGMLVSSPEAINNASFMVIFPMTFIANTFVPIDNFPSVLKTVAEWNPVSTLAQAVREAFGNTDPSMYNTDAWSLHNPIVYTLIWIVILLVIFIPLSVRQYQKTAARSK
ncbi:MAG: ABC transporter permease [Actinobacteria bacterium]|nr:ABC transporter permease [Actinomycetota bacterium]